MLTKSKQIPPFQKAIENQKEEFFFVKEGDHPDPLGLCFHFVVVLGMLVIRKQLQVDNNSLKKCSSSSK